MKVEEYILCAAVWYKDFPLGEHQPKNIDKGIVLCGHRHGCIIQQHVVLMGKRQAEMGSYTQGFLTNKNRFVDRLEALKLALAANQVKDVNNIRKSGLYSEDLY